MFFLSLICSQYQIGVSGIYFSVFLFMRLFLPFEVFTKHFDVICLYSIRLHVCLSITKVFRPLIAYEALVYLVPAYFGSFYTVLVCLFACLYIYSFPQRYTGPCFTYQTP